MKLTKAQRVLLSSSLSVFLVGCGSPNYSQSEVHLTVEEADSNQPVAPDKIPALVKSSPVAPALSGAAGADTYDVVVTNVPVRDLLFALARDAGIDMDVDDRVGGFVSISALDETLDSILTRIGEQVDIRVDTVGDALIIKPDAPYHKHYVIDHLNVSRNYSSSASSSGVGDVGDASVDSSASNDFWLGLEESIQTILDVNFVRSANSAATISDDPTRQGLLNQIASNEGAFDSSANNFSLNRETGVLVVFAPDRLQKEIQKLLDSMLAIASRQVLLEATVVEVVLNNRYAQGIDWSVFGDGVADGIALYQGGVAGGSAVDLASSLLDVTTPNSESIFVPLADAIASGLPFVRQTTEVDGEVYWNGSGFVTVAPGDAQAGWQRAYIAEEGDLLPLSGGGTEPYDPNDGSVGAGSPQWTINPTGQRDYATGTVTTETGLAEIGVYSAEYQAYLAARASEQRGLVPSNPSGDNFFTGAFRQGDISAAVQLLSRFGEAKVLSSPRISALNYQPALLRVVDQEVYFDIEVTESVDTATGQITDRTFEVTENIVDVGFSMNVLPFIKEGGDIVLNLKPAVARILEYRTVPTPGSATQGSISNRIPILRIREMESVIALRDGEIAVLGGLLEDRVGDNNTSVPGLSKIPGVGDLFKQKDETTYKTEFIVFIKAQIINNPSINADYGHYKHLLPDTDFINRGREETMLPPSQEDSR